MEIFKKSGTKERLFEMMGKVNKIQLNESYEDYNTPQENNLDFKYNNQWSPEEIELAKQNYQKQGIDVTNLNNDEFNTMMGDYDISLRENEIEDNSNTPLINNYVDKIEGGLADEKKPNEFDKNQLLKGIRVEMEHTNDPYIALSIVMDHLVENPKYYGEDSDDAEESAMENAISDVVNEDLSGNIENEIIRDLSNVRLDNGIIPQTIVVGENRYEFIEDSLEYLGVNENVRTQPQLKYNTKYKINEMILEIPYLVVIDLKYTANGYEINPMIYIEKDQISLVN